MQGFRVFQHDATHVRVNVTAAATTKYTRGMLAGWFEDDDLIITHPGTGEQSVLAVETVMVKESPALLGAFRLAPPAATPPVTGQTIETWNNAVLAIQNEARQAAVAITPEERMTSATRMEERVTAAVRAASAATWSPQNAAVARMGALGYRLVGTLNLIELGVVIPPSQFAR